MSAFPGRTQASGGRRLLGPALLLALAAVPIAANYVVFAPRNEEIEAARREISSKEARLVGLRELTARIGDLGREIDARENELARLDARLPEREDVDGLLKEITRIAQQVDLAVRTVKGDRPVAAGAAMEVPLSLVLEGSFDALYDFLLALEALPRITRIQSMKVAAIGSDPHAIAGRRGAPGSAGVRAELGLSVYFSAPRAAPSGADASATASTRGGAR
jgi:Tfp pilus assembly protein PilO